jgi:hypothetical protein
VATVRVRDDIERPPRVSPNPLGRHPMLTVDKVAIYRRFKGDSDGFYRSGGTDGAGIDHDDWLLIDDLRVGLHAVHRGLASADFAQSVEQRLLTITADERTRQLLRELAKE